MPGITGIFASEPKLPVNLSRLTTMTEALAHEKFHSHRQEIDPNQGSLLGWAWDVAIADHQQIYWNDTRDVGVLFSGENFYDTIPRFLISYESQGLAALRSLNGSFSGVIIDHREKKQILFNDRYGSARIYWHQSGDNFYFSSEAKSLLRVQPALRKIDQRSLGEHYAVGCVLQNRSLYQGIELLPPGSAWTFQVPGRIEKSRYFEPFEWEQQTALSPQDYEEALVDTFQRVLPRYVQASARLGMSLTGGLDSRMILACLPAPEGSLPCYTFGGTYRDCADVRIARQLAQMAGQNHTVIEVGPKFLEQFLHLAERNIYLSDGTMDVSGAVELFVNRIARTIAPIRLTGNYGSETLRANIAFRPRSLPTGIYKSNFREAIAAATETYRQEVAIHRLSFIAFKQVPWHHYARRSIECSQLVPRSPFLDNDLVSLAYRAPAGQENSAQPVLHLIARANQAMGLLGTDRLLRSRRTTILNRAARTWNEFTIRAEYAYDYGMPQWLARVDRAITPLHLEKLFLGRHKFYHFRIWYRTALAKSVRDLARRNQLETWYQPGAVQHVVDSHTSGRANHTLELHRLLSLQLIEQQMLRTP